MLETIDSCPAPVVARVHGHALGGGCGLVACSDIVVAAPDTRVRLLRGEARDHPGRDLAVTRSRKIGPSAARRYFVTGERFDAATALRIGLVHEVAADLDAAVAAIVAELRTRRSRGGAAREEARARAARRARHRAAHRPAADERRGPGGPARLPREARRVVGIEKLLVANRGEIALRVFRACRELGIATVAVAPEDDAGSLHARSADETVRISSYLDAGEHVRAAQETGADAIHPGYGFLAENADFAEAVEAAGLTWVGPPPEALRAGGDKLEAKRIAREAGVPVVPEGEPDEIGFPLVVKAAAGGGGRGMRVVRDAGGAGRGARGGAARGEGGVRRRARLLRALRRAAAARRDPAARRRAGHDRRARRARVLGAAPPPEGARGGALPRPRSRAARADERGRGRVRAGDRLPQRGHGRVHARRARLLVPGAERPHPGRASGHRARQRRRPRRRAAPDRAGRAADGRAAPGRPRGRGAALRRGSADVPAADRHGSSGCGCRPGSASTPASRRATRSAPRTTR